MSTLFSLLHVGLLLAATIVTLRAGAFRGKAWLLSFLVYSLSTRVVWAVTSNWMASSVDGMNDPRIALIADFWTVMKIVDPLMWLLLLGFVLSYREAR